MNTSLSFPHCPFFMNQSHENDLCYTNSKLGSIDIKNNIQSTSENNRLLDSNEIVF